MPHSLLSALLIMAMGLAGHPQAPEQDASELLRRGLAGTGVQLDIEAGLVAVPARVLVRSDLLEYLLVGRRGAVHESLFLTEVKPSLLNAALLALGCEPGTNAHVQDPLRDDSGEALGDPGEARIVAPSGKESSLLYLYVAWKEAGETYLYRIEDLLTNLETGRAMRRHRFVFLGSRFAAVREGEPKSFVADLEENLINIAFFFQGNTLLTAGLEECVQQTIWAPNAWLLPPREQEIALVFARRRIVELPEPFLAELPVVPFSKPDTKPDTNGEARPAPGAAKK